MLAEYSTGSARFNFLKYPENYTPSWSFFAVYVLYCIRPWTGSHTILKPNYSKHTRPIITIITEINKHTQAQSEISRAIITTTPPPPSHNTRTHCNKAQNTRP